MDLHMDGWTDGLMDGWNGQMNGLTDGWIYVCTDGWTKIGFDVYMEMCMLRQKEDFPKFLHIKLKNALSLIAVGAMGC